MGNNKKSIKFSKERITLNNLVFLFAIWTVFNVQKCETAPKLFDNDARISDDKLRKEVEVSSNLSSASSSSAENKLLSQSAPPTTPSLPRPTSHKCPLEFTTDSVKSIYSDENAALEKVSKPEVGDSFEEYKAGKTNVDPIAEKNMTSVVDDIYSVQINNKNVKLSQVRVTADTLEFLADDQNIKNFEFFLNDDKVEAETHLETNGTRVSIKSLKANKKYCLNISKAEDGNVDPNFHEVPSEPENLQVSLNEKQEMLLKWTQNLAFDAVYYAIDGVVKSTSYNYDDKTRLIECVIRDKFSPGQLYNISVYVTSHKDKFKSQWVTRSYLFDPAVPTKVEGVIRNVTTICLTWIQTGICDYIDVSVKHFKKN